MSDHSRHFEQALADVLGIEGGFSDDPQDSGGATAFGVTEGVARAHGYAGPMHAMPQSVAADIYHRSYWQALLLDDVAAVDAAVARELFDIAVNIGQRTAIRWLQRCLNVFNNRGRHWQDIAVDGWSGPQTLGALGAMKRVRGHEGMGVLHTALNSLQGHHYITLPEARSKDEKYAYGWFLQRVD